MISATHCRSDGWRGAGLLMPMYQSEALWIYFEQLLSVCGQGRGRKSQCNQRRNLGEGLSDSPQSYLVTPEQPWLDGFAVSKGIIRQFVAMPLGAGYSVCERSNLTGKADVGENTA